MTSSDKWKIFSKVEGNYMQLNSTWTLTLDKKSCTFDDYR